MNNDSNTILSAANADATAHEEDTQETVQSLELAIAQISMSMQEADNSVGDLIDAISVMAGCVQRIESRCVALHATSDTDSIHSEYRQVEAAMRQAITAFQFYDLLSQRFLHIQENLRAVADVIQAPDQLHHSLWQDLHNKLGSVYSLDQEQRMYQALLKGLSAENVINRVGTTLQKTCTDVELF